MEYGRADKAIQKCRMHEAGVCGVFAHGVKLHCGWICCFALISLDSGRCIGRNEYLGERGVQVALLLTAL